MAYTQKGQVFGRITLKCDTSENWGKATNFKPFKGEMIIYMSDAATPQIKIGDGERLVGDLPFVTKPLEDRIAALERLITDQFGMVYNESTDTGYFGATTNTTS